MNFDSNSVQYFINGVSAGNDSPLVDGLSTGIRIGAGAAGSGGGYPAAYFDAISVNPVPEPESYASLVAGLTLLGVIAKRKRRLPV